MPNWCHNDLYIGGPVEDVERLLAHIGANENPPRFDFNTVLPYPEQYAKLDAEAEALGYTAFHEKYGKEARDGFNSGGYAWCLDNWGTKWNAGCVARRDYDGDACVTFQTAWDPPTPVIVALAKLFPNCSLHLEYFEQGMERVGGFSCLSRDEAHDMGSPPNAPVAEWEGQYWGHRGG